MPRSDLALVLCASVVVSHSALAESLSSVAHIRGVTISVYRMSGAYLLCMGAEPKTKIAGEYGVEVTVPVRERSLWNEPFPKLTTISQPYFELPLGIELAASPSEAYRRVNLHFGICFDARVCDPIDVSLTVSPRAERNDKGVCPASKGSE